MGFSERLIEGVFVGIPGLFFLVLNLSGNIKYAQDAADSLFLKYIGDATFRLYTFEILVLALFLLVGMIAIHGVKSHATEGMMEIPEGD